MTKVRTRRQKYYWRVANEQPENKGTKLAWDSPKPRSFLPRPQSAKLRGNKNQKKHPASTQCDTAYLPAILG